jgi:hypothetical protein
MNPMIVYQSGTRDPIPLNYLSDQKPARSMVVGDRYAFSTNDEIASREAIFLGFQPMNGPGNSILLEMT